MNLPYLIKRIECSTCLAKRVKKLYSKDSVSFMLIFVINYIMPALPNFKGNSNLRIHPFNILKFQTVKKNSSSNKTILSPVPKKFTKNTQTTRQMNYKSVVISSNCRVSQSVRSKRRAIKGTIN